MAGVILAAAGLIRMGYSEKMRFIVDPDVMIPAIGQGALAIEARESDSNVLERLSFLNDPLTETCVRVERAFLERMGGGCQVPMAAYCAPLGSGFRFTAAVVHPDGKPMFREQYVTDSIKPVDGSQIADLLIQKGASRILREVLGRNWHPGLMLP
jgi:hydroxymethylbilane synthase